MRKAPLSEVPVSTSLRTSLSRRVTLGFGLPRPTMSKACSSGTPAFIMVASWRVKIEMSLGRIDRPPDIRRFLTLSGTMPWRRSAVMTRLSLAARVSPRTALPPRSLPSHSKTYSLTLRTAVAMASPRFDYLSARPPPGEGASSSLPLHGSAGGNPDQALLRAVAAPAPPRAAGAGEGLGRVAF